MSGLDEGGEGEREGERKERDVPRVPPMGEICVILRAFSRRGAPKSALHFSVWYRA